MKIVFVLLTHIDNLPPARNILLEYESQGISFSLVTMYSEALPHELRENPRVNIYNVQSRISSHKLQALFRRIIRRRRLRLLLNKIVFANDVIWTFTDYDSMEAGKILLKHRHVMQLMELIKDIPYFDEFPFLKANISKYAKNAELVIVPETNRAYIQQSYWGLSKTPIVIPNKPNISREYLDLSVLDSEHRKIYEQIKGKKIILYQGVIGYERKLDEFIEAVHLLGNDYCVALMGSDNDELKRLRKLYPYIVYIPFLASPKHLIFTSIAYIGIVTYSQFNNIKYYDPLNAIYCAPNKIYEYSFFGIPMIGNRIPGLELPFNKYGCGLCSELEKNSIKESILEIEKQYDYYSDNARRFYSSFNMEQNLKSIYKSLEDNSCAKRKN